MADNRKIHGDDEQTENTALLDSSCPKQKQLETVFSTCSIDSDQQIRKSSNKAQREFDFIQLE